MELKAGQKAAKKGFFDCNECRRTIYVDKGDTVAACPQCGNGSFSERLLNKAMEWQKEDIGQHR